MTHELALPLFAAACMAAALIFLSGAVAEAWKRRKARRRKAKMFRRSAEPPKLPVAHQQRTTASIGKAPARKTKARIGVHRRLNR